MKNILKISINLKQYTETHRYWYVPILEEKRYALRYSIDNLDLDTKRVIVRSAWSAVVAGRAYP